MNLSRQIAEAKGWNTLIISGGEVYHPETNKEQAMDLLIEMVDSFGLLVTFKRIIEQFLCDTSEENTNIIIYICKAWLAAFKTP